MNIHIYDINDKKKEEVLFFLDENLVEDFYDDLIKVGISIDIYGTTRIFNSNIIKLLDVFKNSENLKFILFLKEALKNKKSLIIEGN